MTTITQYGIVALTSMNRNGSALECAMEFTPFSLFGPSFFHVFPVSVLQDDSR